MSPNPTPDSIKFFMARLEEALEQTSPEALPEILGDLERIKSCLWVRMLNSKPKDAEPATPLKDKLLTAQEAAQILGTKPMFLYKNSKTLPFARKFSRKVLRFSEAGLRRWMESRRPK